MNNYTVRVYSVKDLIDVFYNKDIELGQAMILVKTISNEIEERGLKPEEYAWHISNYDINIEEGDIDTIFGRYDNIGRPIINEIKTEE